MQTRVQKWGNSLGVRIPRGLAEEVGLGAGSEVSLSTKNGELVVKPSIPARISLDDAVDADHARAYAAVATGEKALIVPH